ncbi:MAG: hypothetical protein JXB45_04665 [Candidatus Krumholzibacteriota bacterium]|nr:hypothetical protein [Candidatus Krumholzibacteriota bacterium]
MNRIKSLFRARVLRHQVLTPSCRLVVFDRPAGFPAASPGHFVSVRVSDSSVPLLRRPFSILDLTAGELILLVKIVGRGSALLAGANPGDGLEIGGPFGGTVFEPPARGKAVFVAGGTGLAPAVFAARTWNKGGLVEEIHLVHGASTRDELLTGFCEKDFSHVHQATLDGSAGFGGDAVSLLEKLVNDGVVPLDALFSCGPRGMIRALVERVGSRFAEHHASLEAVMACGVGACRGCTVPVRENGETLLRAVCSDGTVFPAGDIAWEEWED